MPCFGSRKKNKRKNVPIETATTRSLPSQATEEKKHSEAQQQPQQQSTNNRPPSITSSVVQIRQEYKELKTKVCFKHFLKQKSS